MNLESPPKDDTSMKRAHPFRAAEFCAGTGQALRQRVGEAEWGSFLELLRDESFAAATLLRGIYEKRLRGIEEVLRLSVGLEGSTDVGGAIPFLVMMRHLEMPYPIFRVDDTLVDILTKTDISDDLTVSMLPLPFRRLYVELGQARNLKLSVSNVSTGQHIFEGAYIEEGQHEQYGKGYFLVLTGSPLGKSHAMDDATHAIFVPTGAQDARLQDVLTESVKAGNQHARMHGLRETPVDRANEAYECVLLLIKALLYISLPEARRELHPERTEAIKELQRVKSGSKRAKAERRLKRLSDYIVIKAASAHEKTFSQDLREGGVKPHWRRAHYRMQAHGPRMTLRKLVFITEVLVAAGSSPDAPKPSNYAVE
jgi:hypothetical protein